MGLWNRIFAAAYDPFVAAAETKGIAKARRDLLREARGRVLEIGAGTGLNVEHYPSGIDLVLTEPDEHMAKRLRGRAGDAEVVITGAERLPFEDGTFDARTLHGARWQDRAQRPWRAFAAGCNCNRDLLASLAAESFELVELRRENWRFMPPIVRPVVIGAAAPHSA